MKKSPPAICQKLPTKTSTQKPTITISRSQTPNHNLAAKIKRKTTHGIPPSLPNAHRQRAQQQEKRRVIRHRKHAHLRTQNLPCLDGIASRQVGEGVAEDGVGASVVAKEAEDSHFGGGGAEGGQAEIERRVGG